MDVRISDSPFCGAAWRGAEASLFVLPKPENCGTDRPMRPCPYGGFSARGEVPAPLARRFSAGVFCHLERSIRTDEP